MDKTRPLPKYTGLRCVSCHEPTAHVESAEAGRLTMSCPGCGHRWSYEQSGDEKRSIALPTARD